MIEDAFNDYLEQLCDTLGMMMDYNAKNDFVNTLNKSACDNFFMDNLFLFHQIAFHSNSKHSHEIKILYNTISNNLFHYTTFSSLEKIITNKSLLLKNLPNLNDTLEGRALIEYITNRSNNQKCTLAKRSMINLTKQLTEYNSKVFSFSFTTLNDDASQWERYGVPKTKDDNSQKEKISDKEKATDSSCGVSIEFSAEKISQFIGRNAKQSKFIRLHPVLYIADYKTTNYWLERFYTYATAKNSCDNIIQLHNSLYQGSPTNNNHDNCLIKLYSDYSSYIKHSSFKSEREIRLLLDLNDTTFEFINTKYMDKNYVLLEFTDNCDFKLSDLITSITIGPEASDYKSKIEKLLKDNNFKVDIKKSDCPLRKN
jgi:hypothetical protein